MVSAGTYNIILCDPPWTYRDKALAGSRGAGCKYPLLTHKDLKNLAVDKLASDNCALFMWVTMPMLPEVFDIMEAWGFTYRTNAFTWIKLNKSAGTFFWGMGSSTRANAELCLLATKGKMKRIKANVHSIIQTPISKHSSKPLEAKNRIIQLYGDLPRIELFAREQTSGWDAIGFDIDGQDIRTVLNNL